MEKGAKSIMATFLEAQDRLVLQASDLSLETIANMVGKKAIDIAPHYQRRERWAPQQQSALIESFILNIPVPPVYLAEDDFGRYSVIDGKQRISAITAFLGGQLRLSSLESFPELNGLQFGDLPEEIRNALSVRPYVRVVTLLKQSDPELKYEVFTRLNKGGESLNAQEIRNVAFRGPLNDIIYKLADHVFLKRQLKIVNEKSPAYRNMADAEYVLRFLTLSEVWKNFSGSLVRSMDSFMRDRRQAKGADLDSFQKSFLRSIDASRKIWGDNAFRRPVEAGWRDQIIAGMYDAEMISVTLFTDKELERLVHVRKKAIDGTVKLFETDDEFDEAVRLGTNTPSRVRYRVNTLRGMLAKLV